MAEDGDGGAAGFKAFAEPLTKEQLQQQKRSSMAAMMNVPGLRPGGKKQSIAAAAAASAAGAANAAQRGVITRAKRRQSLADLDEGSGYSTHLDSEVSQEEAEGMFTYVQTKSASLQIFTEEELPVLVQMFSVLHFEEGQDLVTRGEPGTWFGVVLTGCVDVILPTGAVVPVPPGTIIGEMVVWNQGSRRQATMKGGTEGGMLAIMLRSDLPDLMARNPQICQKLLRVMGKSAFLKQLDNERRERSSKLEAGIAFHDATTQTQAGKEGIAKLVERLTKENFDEDEAHAIASIAQIAVFKESTPILEAGQHFPYVLILLSGELTIDADVGRYAVDLREGDQLGTLEYFGVDEFRQSSRVSAKQGGIIAGLPWESLDQVVVYNSDLTLKLFSWLGTHAMSVIRGGSKPDPSKPDPFTLLESVGGDEDAGGGEGAGGAETGAETGADGADGAGDAEAGNRVAALPNRRGSAGKGQGQMETFWLLKLQAQEAKMNDKKGILEKQEALKQKEEEVDLLMNKTQHSVSNYKVLYARQERKLEEKEAERAKLETELLEVREKELSKIEEKLEKSKKRVQESLEYEQKLLVAVKKLAEKVAEYRPPPSADGGEDSVGHLDDELSMLLADASRLVRQGELRDKPKRGAVGRRASASTTKLEDANGDDGAPPSLRRPKAKTEPTPSTRRGSNLGSVSEKQSLVSNRRGSERSGSIQVGSLGSLPKGGNGSFGRGSNLRRDSTASTSLDIGRYIPPTTNSSMQTEAGMGSAETGSQTEENSFHTQTTAGTALRDGESLVASINRRSSGPQLGSAPPSAEARIARRSGRRGSVVNMGTASMHAVPSPGGAEGSSPGEDERSFRQHGNGRSLVEARRASAERVVLGYGTTRGQSSHGDGPPKYDLLGRPVVLDDDDDDDDDDEYESPSKPSKPSKTKSEKSSKGKKPRRHSREHAHVELVDAGVQVNYNELRIMKQPTLNTGYNTVSDGQLSPSHPSLDQYLHLSGASSTKPEGAMASAAATSAVLGAPLCATGGELNAPGMVASAYGDGGDGAGSLHPSAALGLRPPAGLRASVAPTPDGASRGGANSRGLAIDDAMGQMLEQPTHDAIGQPLPTHDAMGQPLPTHDAMGNLIPFPPQTASAATEGAAAEAQRLSEARQMQAILGSLGLPHVGTRGAWRTNAGWQPRYVATRSPSPRNPAILAAIPAEAKPLLDRALKAAAEAFAAQSLPASRGGSPRTGTRPPPAMAPGMSPATSKPLWPQKPTRPSTRGSTPMHGSFSAR